MKAVCWQGINKVGVETVSDPHIINEHDCIVKVTSSAICGSDLHLYGGRVPTLLEGDILGHEFMGEVVEIGNLVKKLKVGDKVVVPFNIACGHCIFCEQGKYSACDNSNPNSHLSLLATGQCSGGMFGYTHMCGGFAGGQAEYVRVPYADVGPLVVPKEIDDEKLLFLSDIFPTGFMAAENCNIKPGDTVAVWGGGPVGQFAIRSAFFLGASRVIAIDCFPERLKLASKAGAMSLNYQHADVYETLQRITGGNGPDSCIDAVGMEAEGHGFTHAMDTVKAFTRLQPDRAFVLRQVIHCCKKAGTVSIPGAYMGWIDKFNFGQIFNKGLTIKTGQTNTRAYMPYLLEKIIENKIDPSIIISHRITIDEAPRLYKQFLDEKENCTKVVIKF